MKKIKRAMRDLILNEKYLKIYCDTKEHIYFKGFNGNIERYVQPCGCSKYGIEQRNLKKNGQHGN